MQLFFRICSLIVAMGMLVCVICIKGTNDTEGWIIRVPVSFTTPEKCFTKYLKSLAWPYYIPFMQFIIWLDLQSSAHRLRQPVT